MATYVRKRRSVGDWIMRAAADHADIRTPAELLAFLLCGACVAAIGWMVFHPREFYCFVMGGVL